MKIPSEVIHLCYIFWKPVDIWNEEMLIKSRSMIRDNYILRHVSKASSTVFGTRIVTINETCSWRLKIKKYDVPPSNYYGIQIGIIANDPRKLKKMRFAINWYQEHIDCYWYKLRDGSIHDPHDSNEISITQGDIIGMHLDMTSNINTLQFTQNEEIFGQSIDVIPQNYRLAVGFLGYFETYEIKIV